MIAGGFGPAQRVVVRSAEGSALSPNEPEVVVRFALARVSLQREARMSAVDLAILRVGLADAGTRLLPVALVVRDEDRRIVAELLRAAERAAAPAA